MPKGNFSKCPETSIPPRPVFSSASPEMTRAGYQPRGSTPFLRASFVRIRLSLRLCDQHSPTSKKVNEIVSSRDMPTSPGAAKIPRMLLPETPSPAPEVSEAQGVHTSHTYQNTLQHNQHCLPDQQTGFVYVPRITVDAKNQTHS